MFSTSHSDLNYLTSLSCFEIGAYRKGKMEIQYEGRKCGVQDLCADIMAESDAEETLSFCDMLLYDSAGTASTQSVSNADSSDRHEFFFDLALGSINSKANCASSAEDLFQHKGSINSKANCASSAEYIFRHKGSINSKENFASSAEDLFLHKGSINSKANCVSSAADLFLHKGRILPLTECTARMSYSDSNYFRQIEVVSKEDVKAWRSESLKSKSSFWTSSSSNSSQASQRSLNYSASQKNFRAANSARNKIKGITNWSSFSSDSRSKKCPKWLQFISFGGIKAPGGMNTEDMRLRQCERYDNGSDSDQADFKRSVSSSFEEGLTLMKKEANCRQKLKSVKENKRAVEAPRTKGFGMFTLLNNCKFSISSMIACR